VCENQVLHYRYTIHLIDEKLLLVMVMDFELLFTPKHFRTAALTTITNFGIMPKHL